MDKPLTLECLVRDELDHNPTNMPPVSRARHTMANISPELRRYLETDTNKVVENLPLAVREAAVVAIGSVGGANLWLQLSWESLDWYTPIELIEQFEDTEKVLDLLSHIRHWRLGR